MDDCPKWLIDKLNENGPIVSAPLASITLHQSEVKRIRAALAYLQADDRDVWLKIGMALHASGAGDQAFGMWCEWAQQSEKFDLADSRRVWDSFKPGKGIGVATVFGMAKSVGWMPPEQVRPPEPPVEVYSGDVSKPAQQPKKTSILDEERHYCSVNLLQHIDDDHILKQLSKQLSQATHIPESTICLMALAVVSSMTCRKWAVLYHDGQRLVIGLYAVAEQPSGTGKSRCLKVFQEPFIDAYITAKQNISKDIALLDGQTDLTEAQTDELEQLKIKQRDLSGPLFVTNATPEGLETALNLSSGYFAAVSSEQGLLNSLLGLLYGQTANNNDVVLNGFDGGYVSSLRISRTAFSGRVVGALACFAQPGSIETVIENSQGTGYAERFLLLAEPHFLGNRDHTKRVVIDPGLLHQFNRVTDFAVDIFQNPRTFQDLSVLTLSDTAHEEIAIFRNEIEPHLVDGGRYSHIAIRGAAAKINIQVMKIAANLHLTSINRHKNQIDDGFVVSAIGIAHELLEANLTLCTDKGIVGQCAEFTSIISLFENDPRPRLERAIINSKRQTKPFSDFTGNKSEKVRDSLNEMVERGLLVRTTRGDKKYYTLGQ